MDRKTVEQHRLATFGRFVMGVSHELDNHLSVILGFAELIQIAGGEPRKALDGAEKILAAGEKINAIVKQFSQHVRPHDPRAEPFIPGEVVSEVALFAHYDLCRGNVALRLPGSWPKGTACGDRRDFGLAMLALLLNGAEAMAGKGGELVLTARVHEGMWELTVTDEGPGVQPDLLRKIFTEGFTTKSAAYHAGMGLPVARHLAGELGGAVAIANAASGGCAAVLTFPVA